MGLLHHLETQLERQILAQLQVALRQALDDCQPLCERCRLAAHRHHRYARAIATSYGEVRVQIPVFRCGQCRRMADGMTLLGEEMRHQRFPPKNRDATISLAAPGLSYARAGKWVGCVKSAISKWLRIMRVTAGAAGYWCEKALSKGLRHLATGPVAHRTTSRLERHNRELRRREQLGTVWTEHNLLALLQEQGLLNQIT